SPDGKWVALVSDSDGWDHLYVVSVAGGPVAQITTGPAEVTRFAWSSDSSRIVFDRSDVDRPGTRQIVVAAMHERAWNAATLEPMTRGRGTNTNARWSPD